MSGGGGDYTPVSHDGPCDKLSAETALQSANPDVVASLEVGERLELRLLDQAGRQTVLVMQDETVAGSLVFAGLQRLIECLLEGKEFEAEVVAIAGPVCRLRVRPK
jgi:hypothetical protein